MKTMILRQKADHQAREKGEITEGTQDSQDHANDTEELQNWIYSSRLQDSKES